MWFPNWGHESIPCSFRKHLYDFIPIRSVITSQISNVITRQVSHINKILAKKLNERSCSTRWKIVDNFTFKYLIFLSVIVPLLPEYLHFEVAECKPPNSHIYFLGFIFHSDFRIHWRVPERLISNSYLTHIYFIRFQVNDPLLWIKGS